jgi:hypothetical protein
MAVAVSAAGLRGSVIVVSLAQDPVLMWDASADVRGIVNEQTPDAAANALLERDALHAIAGKLDVLKSTTGTLSLRIIYYKLQPAGTNYDAVALAGTVVYATVEMPVVDALKNRDDWTGLSDKAKVPAWIRFKTTGPLPPR